jgi:hypothetical protein
VGDGRFIASGDVYTQVVRENFLTAMQIRCWLGVSGRRTMILARRRWR